MTNRGSCHALRGQSADSNSMCMMHLCRSSQDLAGNAGASMTHTANPRVFQAGAMPTAHSRRRLNPTRTAQMWQVRIHAIMHDHHDAPHAGRYNSPPEWTWQRKYPVDDPLAHLLTTLPDLSMRNLEKFHLMSLNRTPPCFVFMYLYTGSAAHSSDHQHRTQRRTTNRRHTDGRARSPCS